MSRQTTIAIGGGLLGVISLFFRVDFTNAQDKRYAVEQFEGQGLRPFEAVPAESLGFLGMRRCALCHNQPDGFDPVIKKEFVLMNEFQVFLAEDAHARAHELLLVPDGLGQRIGEKLGMVDISQAKECLNCHSSWSRQGSEMLRSSESGVTCESCHGPSRGWDHPHSEPAWRKQSNAAKKKLGMVDVRDPVRRAQLCYSCHIGSVEEGKLVTHDMYAAGHPPLPSIEIETIIAANAAHSRKLEEKGAFEFRDEFIANMRLAGAAGEHIFDGLPRTKGVLLGGLLAFRHSLNVFAMQAQAADRPEFAVYDCQSCHREFRVPTRQQGHSGIDWPDRPRLPDWPAVLLPIALSQIEPNPVGLQLELDALNQRMRRLNSALDERLSGGSDSAFEAIEGKDGLIAWLDQKANALSALSISPADAHRALQAIYELGDTEILDFHSACQIVRAIGVIETETRAPYPRFSPRPANATFMEQKIHFKQDTATYFQWRAEVLQPAKSEAARILGPLRKQLRLGLAAGQKTSIGGDSLQAVLKSTAGYSPEQFRKLLKQCADSRASR